MNNYLIIGNSTRIVDKKIKELIDFNNETIYFNMLFNDISEVLEEASYHSLFMEQKNIIVYNAESIINDKIKEDGMKKIVDYLNNNDELTKLVFVSKEKISKYNIFSNYFKNNNTLFDLLKDKVDLNKIIIDYCKENRYTIDANAINILKKSLSNNCDLILQELDKLFLYYNEPCEIKADVVMKNCSNIVDENNFKFVDLVITKKYKESFEYLNELLIKKVEPLSLFSLLVREFRLMLLYKVIESNDKDYSNFMKNYNLKDWQLEKIGRNAYSYKLDDLKRIMKILCKYDVMFKSGKIDKANFFDLLLIEIYK